MPILTLIMLSHLLFCITNYVNNKNQFYIWEDAQEKQR